VEQGITKITNGGAVTGQKRDELVFNGGQIVRMGPMVRTKKQIRSEVDLLPETPSNRPDCTCELCCTGDSENRKTLVQTVEE
jgi:hypothetical protein